MYSALFKGCLRVLKASFTSEDASSDKSRSSCSSPWLKPTRRAEFVPVARQLEDQSFFTWDRVLNLSGCNCLCSCLYCRSNNESFSLNPPSSLQDRYSIIGILNTVVAQRPSAQGKGAGLRLEASKECGPHMPISLKKLSAPSTRCRTPHFRQNSASCVRSCALQLEQALAPPASSARRMHRLIPPRLPQLLQIDQRKSSIFEVKSSRVSQSNTYLFRAQNSPRSL